MCICMVCTCMLCICMYDESMCVCVYIYIYIYIYMRCIYDMYVNLHVFIICMFCAYLDPFSQHLKSEWGLLGMKMSEGTQKRRLRYSWQNNFDINMTSRCCGATEQFRHKYDIQMLWCDEQFRHKCDIQMLWCDVDDVEIRAVHDGKYIYVYNAVFLE
jgi:hypothetical protein